MKTKIIVALLASSGVAATATAASTATLDANSTSKIALIDFSGTGGFSFDMLVTPSATNTLKLTFAKPLAGAFDTLTYSLFDGASLVKSYSITSTAVSTTFNDAAAAFSDVSLVGSHVYKLTFAGNVAAVNASNFAQYKISTNGTIAAVPEPESYAMLLAGLGLMGGIARRRSLSK